MEEASLSLLLLCVFLLIVTCVFTKDLFCQRNQPPGPGVLQLIKIVLFKKQHLSEATLNELSKKYGPVFTLDFWITKVVFVAGWKAIKAALNHDVLSSKSISPIIRDLRLFHGIVYANGESLKEMRRFTLSTLKEFGMGRKMGQEKIMDELQHLMQGFEEKQGKAFNNSLLVSNAVSNVICSIIFGRRFEYDDLSFKSLLGRMKVNSQLLGSPRIQLYNFFPKLLKHVKERGQVMKGSLANRSQVIQLIKESEKTLEPHFCRGLVDAFLLRKKQLEESGIRNSHYHDDNLIVSCVNLLVGGTDSTSATVQYGLLLMAKYPEAQDRVHQELDRVVGSQPVQPEDAKSMPFTQAVINETQRLLSVFPILSHSAVRDVSFQGYSIKKETPVKILMSSAFRDEDEWEKPHSFHPGHFLDEDGNLRRREAFFPFSEGSRSCVGQSLAKMTLFIFFASLLQRFQFTPPPGVKKEDLELTRVPGLSVSPLPHDLCAIKRI
ncbi:unnamed protein product [Ophioblennius macclurei]